MTAAIAPRHPSLPNPRNGGCARLDGAMAVRSACKEIARVNRADQIAADAGSISRAKTYG